MKKEMSEKEKKDYVLATILRWYVEGKGNPTSKKSVSGGISVGYLFKTVKHYISTNQEYRDILDSWEANYKIQKYTSKIKGKRVQFIIPYPLLEVKKTQDTIRNLDRQLKGISIEEARIKNEINRVQSEMKVYKELSELLLPKIIIPNKVIAKVTEDVFEEARKLKFRRKDTECD